MKVRLVPLGANWKMNTIPAIDRVWVFMRIGGLASFGLWANHIADFLLLANPSYFFDFLGSLLDSQPKLVFSGMSSFFLLVSRSFRDHSDFSERVV